MQSVTTWEPDTPRFKPWFCPSLAGWSWSSCLTSLLLSCCINQMDLMPGTQVRDRPQRVEPTYTSALAGTEGLLGNGRKHGSMMGSRGSRAVPELVRLCGQQSSADLPGSPGKCCRLPPVPVHQPSHPRHPPGTASSLTTSLLTGLLCPRRAIFPSREGEEM